MQAVGGDEWQATQGLVGLRQARLGKTGLGRTLGNGPGAEGEFGEPLAVLQARRSRFLSGDDGALGGYDVRDLSTCRCFC